MPMQNIARHVRTGKKPAVEWLTIALFVIVWLLFIAVTINYQQLPWWFLLPCGGCLLALYGSMQHEVIHGHPTKWRRLNELMVFPSLWIWLPFGIYRDTHLHHHRNELITDPFDDPESYYVASSDWDRMSGRVRRFYLYRNTLAGRLVLGPVWMIVTFLKQEFSLCVNADNARLRIWSLHLLSVTLTLLWLRYCQIPLIEYFVFFIYPGFSLTLLRSFLEHQAEPDPQHRTVIVNSGPVLSLLFLNNNLHALHHEQPALAWYQLPGVWENSRADILHRNGGYYYHGYRSLFRRYSFAVKTHPRHPFI